jgi:CCR4-NOT transcription complex subunit 4
LNTLQQFRIVIPNLLYVIGLPVRIADPELLQDYKFFGQFGKIKRILVNNQTKNFYE